MNLRRQQLPKILTTTSTPTSSRTTVSSIKSKSEIVAKQKTENQNTSTQKNQTQTSQTSSQTQRKQSNIIKTEIIAKTLPTISDLPIIIDNTPKNQLEQLALLKPNRPELKNQARQIVHVLIGPKNYPKHPKTLFFYYDEKLNKNYKLPEGFKVQDIEIKEKKFMIMFKAYKNIPLCLSEPMKYNNIIRTTLYDNTNIIWSLLSKEKMENLIRDINKYQRYNHFPTTKQISRKDNLYMNYERMKKKFPKDYNYMPETYILPRDKEIFDKMIKDYKITEKNMWLIKPVASSLGNGIHLMTDVNTIPQKTLVSHYVSNPLLIQNKKFDLRLYLLITGYSPLKMYLYDDGLVRFCSEEYSLSLDEEKLNNRFIHLTNYAVNKENDKYQKNDDASKEMGSKWSIKTLKKYFRENKMDWNKVWDKIKDIIIKVILSITDDGIPVIKKFNVSSNNLFEIFGVDILIDENLTPWLMEVNLNPSLNCDSNLDLKIKCKLTTDIFNLIGCVPFTHDGKFEIMEKEYEYKNEVEESLNETICEFMRPNGGFIRIFPKKNNIDVYRKFLEKPGEENEALWKYIKGENRDKVYYN